MKARHQQIIATLTLAFAFAGVLIGTAQAVDRQAGTRGVGSRSTDMSDVFTRAVARAHAVPAVRPDDRAGLRGVGSTSASTPIAPTDVFERAVRRHNTSTSPRPDDRAGLRGAGELAASTPPATTTSEGFRWTDAGVGAAATLALIVILAALALARANHQRDHAILD